jgi:hypothetical protein
MGLLTDITDAVGLTDTGASEEAFEKATGLTKAQIARLDAIDLPDIEKMRLALEAPELVGQLVAEEVGPSALEDISTDPRLAGAQLEALRAMQERSETGLTQTDKYDIEEALGMAAGQERAQRASIEQEMARRGMGDSGQSLMMKLQAQQASANQGRKASMDTARQAAQQKQAALQQMGQMAGQMEGSQFNRQAQVASAKDRIAAANAANRYQTSAQNLAARQAIANQRAALANQQQMYNKGLQQQQFQNELAKTGAIGGATGQMAGMYQNQAQAQAQADASTISSLAGLGSAYLGAQDGGIMRAQDGGIAQKQAHDEVVGKAQVDSAKQHEAFKKKYMKKVQDELLGSNDAKKVAGQIRAEDGALASNRSSEVYNNLLQELLGNPPQYACGGVHKAEDGAMYNSDGMGDIVDSGMESFAGDRVDAKINDGEMILNVPQQQRLMDMIRGEISSVELGDEDIVEGVPREYAEELHEESEEESKLKGLEKLLEALGRS